MAKFKIEKGSAGHTWKATGTNPKTGRPMTITGGQAGVEVGSKNKSSEKTFDSRHGATGMTPKKYINKLRWDDKAAFGSTVNIPDGLFDASGAKSPTPKSAGAKAAAKKGAQKKAAPKKSVAKKAASKTPASKKSAAKKGAAKKSPVKKAASKSRR